jgi:hypothetical protein
LRPYILNMRIILEKCREYNIDLHACPIDYSKVFDRVQHQKLWIIMKEIGFPMHLIHLLTLYHDQKAAIRLAGETSDWFEDQKGIKQGCILSPYLFNIYAEHIKRNVRNSNNCASFDPLSVSGLKVLELIYADDTVLLSQSPKGLEN